MNQNPIDKEVFELLDQARPAKQNHRQLMKSTLLVLVALIVIGLAWKAYTFMVAPRGEITSPPAGFPTDRLVEIKGFTKNIPLNRRYIWVTVDVPKIGLCWPKRPIYKYNSLFKTKFLEQGPNPEFMVSLYAVDQSYNSEILTWFKERKTTKSHAGLPLLPEEYKLYSIKLRIADKLESSTT